MIVSGIQRSEAYQLWINTVCSVCRTPRDTERQRFVGFTNLTGETTRVKAICLGSMSIGWILLTLGDFFTLPLSFIYLFFLSCGNVYTSLHYISFCFVFFIPDSIVLFKSESFSSATKCPRRLLVLSGGNKRHVLKPQSFFFFFFF